MHHVAHCLLNVMDKWYLSKKPKSGVNFTNKTLSTYLIPLITTGKREAVTILIKLSWPTTVITLNWYISMTHDYVEILLSLKQHTYKNNLRTLTHLTNTGLYVDVT